MLLDNQNNQIIKGNIKKINIPDVPVKIADHVRELMEYTKEHIIRDAALYLTNLSKINEESNLTKDRNMKNKKINEYFIELEESDGLKLIKIDSLKMSYYFHLEIKTNYNFTPLLAVDSDDLSQEVSENLYEIQLKRYKSKNSSKGTDNITLLHDLRKIKHTLFFKICFPLDLDIYIACVAWVYFEFLIKKGVVHKKNRNLYLCVVFLLALKFYDIDDIRYVDNFYELSSKCFEGKVKRKDIIDQEMKVFGNLNFALSVPLEIIEKHMYYAKKKFKSRKSLFGSEKNDIMSL